MGSGYVAKDLIKQKLNERYLCFGVGKPCITCVHDGAEELRDATIDVKPAELLLDIRQEVCIDHRQPAIRLSGFIMRDQSHDLCCFHHGPAKKGHRLVKLNRVLPGGHTMSGSACTWCLDSLYGRKLFADAAANPALHGTLSVVE